MAKTSHSADAPPALPGAEPRRSGYVHALERVQLVAAWHTRRINQERDAASPDQDLIEKLVQRLRQCLDDERELPAADPARVAQVAADYAALYKDLRSR